MKHYDVEELAALDRDEIETRAAKASQRIEQRIKRVQDEERDLTSREQDLSYDDRAELSALRDAISLKDRQVLAERRSQQIVGEIGRLTDERSGLSISGHSPLLVSDLNLRSHASAIREGRGFGVEEVETRATVTVGADLGSEGSWGSPEIREPVTLRRFAGIPVGPLTGATAQHPQLTLPAGAAGVGESTAHSEYDAIDKVDLSTLRYGRWTAVTSFADAFDQLTAINRAHSIGIARDLNLADGDAIETAAGGPIGFDADLLDQNVRQAVLQVAAATLAEPDEVVLFGRAAALAVVTGYAPTSGGDRGSVTTRVFGARVYAHEQATAGIVYAFNPAAFLAFADRLRSASVVEPDDGSHKFGSWLHSTPASPAVVGGAAAVDVVTP